MKADVHIVYIYCVYYVIGKAQAKHLEMSDPEVALSFWLSCLRQARKECVCSSIPLRGETIRLGLKKGTQS